MNLGRLQTHLCDNLIKRLVSAWRTCMAYPFTLSLNWERAMSKTVVVLRFALMAWCMAVVYNLVLWAIN